MAKKTRSPHARSKSIGSLGTVRAIPPTAKGMAKAAEIVAAALALFIQGGYAEMTMRKVADRVGISLSNVQHYFPTRKSLLQTMLDEVLNSYEPAYAEVQTKFHRPRERLAAFIRYLLADAKHPEIERLFIEIWSLATRDPFVRSILDRMYTHHRRNFAALVAATNPRLSPGQVARRAALVAMQIEGLALLITDSKPKHPELKGIEEECVTAMLRIVEAR